MSWAAQFRPPFPLPVLVRSLFQSLDFGVFPFVQGWDLYFANILPCYDVVNLTSQVLESLNHEQWAFFPFFGFSESTHLPHEICNSRVSLDVSELIFWDLLGKVLRIVHANFCEVSLRFNPVLIDFSMECRAVFLGSFSENWQDKSIVLRFVRSRDFGLSGLYVMLQHLECITIP